MNREEVVELMDKVEGVEKWNISLGVEAGLLYGAMRLEIILIGLAWKWTGRTNEEP